MFVEIVLFFVIPTERQRVEEFVGSTKFGLINRFLHSRISRLGVWFARSE
ncbi:MAG: hypothetical protein V1655_03955 [bacterium]